MHLARFVCGVAWVLAVAAFAGGCSSSNGSEPVETGPGPESPASGPDVTKEATIPDAEESPPTSDAPQGDERPVWHEMLPEHATHLPYFPAAPRQETEAEGEDGTSQAEPQQKPRAEDSTDEDSSTDEADTAAVAEPDPGSQAGEASPTQHTPRWQPDDEVNPAVATVDGVTLTAADFVDRLFHMHHDWYLHFMRELYVDRVARLEAEREGIEFSEAQVERGFQRLVAYYRERARRMGQSWRLHWQELGYASEEAYLEHIRRYVHRLMLLDRLIVLMDLRLTKVDFSQITIPDKVDRWTPDPEEKAKELVEDLRAGEVEWNTAVRRQSADWQTSSEGGRQGVTPRGFLGVPEMDEFLFNHEPGEISEPIYHPLGQWRILKINAVHHGQKDMTYAEAREEIEANFADALPGTVRGKDTFVWLEEVLREGHYDVHTFSPLAPEGKPWVATIDGEAVTARDLLRHASQTKPDWTQQVITEVIVFHVASTEAEREGIQLDPAEVRRGARQTLEHLKTSTEERGQDFQLIWQRRGYESEAAFRRSVIKPRVRESMKLERLVFLHDRRMERREVWHVLTQAQGLAQRAYERITSGSYSFEEAARRFSQHRPTKEEGGRIGVVPEDLFGPDFSDVAFALEPGEVSEPVQTDNGWHVIKVTDVLEARPELTWREARRDIEAAIAEIPGIPGGRVPVSDTYRWIAAVQGEGGYEILVHVLLGHQAAAAEWYEERAEQDASSEEE